MLIKSFIRAGVHGDASHTQTMDYMNFANYPDDIVYRQSVPHGGHMPPIKEITRRMEKFGYEVVHVVIDREDEYLMRSQVKRGHRYEMKDAKANLIPVREYITEQMKEMAAEPAMVQYEDFVNSAEVRRKFFEAYSLPEPDMHFFNANDTYNV